MNQRCLPVNRGSLEITIVKENNKNTDLIGGIFGSPASGNMMVVLVRCIITLKKDILYKN